MSTIRYQVPLVAQGTSPVCWLACAVMIIWFKRGSKPSTAEIAPQTGWDFRNASVMGAKSNHAVYDALRRLGFVVARGPSRPRGCAPPDEEHIRWLLSNHGPFMLCHHVGAFSYGPACPVPPPSPGMPPGQHVVVITGYDAARRRVYFNNPWDEGNSDVPTTASSIVGAIHRFESVGLLPIAYLP
jgi:hypothetical protein